MFLNFYDARAVVMRAAIDAALKALEEKLSEVIFLRANLYTDAMWYVTQELRDDEIRTGVTDRIRNATCKEEGIAEDDRTNLIEACIAASIACRDACAQTTA